MANLDFTSIYTTIGEVLGTPATIVSYILNFYG